MPIVFLPGPRSAGSEQPRPIPLQKVRSVYRLGPDGTSVEKLELALPAGRPLFVSHFETCPGAAAFSKAARR